MKTFSKHSQVLVHLSFVLFFTAILFTGCTNNEPPANEVYINNMAYSPATITVTAGTTIKWTNKDGVAHTVTSDTSGIFDSGNLNTGAVYSHTFLTAGTYNYHCTYHASMKAKVVVN
jgi:plastocyanin